jgi:hypothetical protein
MKGQTLSLCMFMHHSAISLCIFHHLLLNEWLAWVTLLVMDIETQQTFPAANNACVCSSCQVLTSCGIRFNWVQSHSWRRRPGVTCSIPHRPLAHDVHVTSFDTMNWQTVWISFSKNKTHVFHWNIYGERICSFLHCRNRFTLVDVQHILKHLPSKMEDSNSCYKIIWRHCKWYIYRQHHAE